MRNEIELLINSIKRKSNPIIIANEASYFLTNLLKHNRINLYEAYLLNSEVIRFMRLGYTQPAWNWSVQISTCIAIMNQKLLADIFEEDACAKKYYEWGIEAFHLNKEKRPHYIMDKYKEYLKANSHKELLIKLFEIRRNYSKLNFQDGPYHTESFPYNYYSPEHILLNDGEKEKYYNDRNINDDIERLIMELDLTL